MDSTGFFAANIQLDARDFLQRLDEGTRDWFYERLDDRMGHSLDDQTKQALDMSTDDGRDRIWKTRTRQSPEVSSAISYVLQGDCKMGLAHMDRSWPRTGFGKFAHMNPDFCLKLAVEVKKMVCELNIPCSLSGPPHLIYKPPNGSLLKEHHDAISPNALLRELRLFMQGTDTSVTAWVKQHGFQCLVHITGGRTDGATFTIGPMTPAKLLLCMEAFHDGRVAVPDKWFSDGEGPHFLKWRSLLPQLNPILVANKESPLAVVPMVPPEASDLPFVVLWPKGFPHGSQSNSARRISSTVCLSTTPLASKRFLKRARSLAQLHSEDEAERARARNWLDGDTVPYEEGRTHKKPHLARRWMQPGGPYASLAPTNESVDEFEAHVA